jgi:hypothetical protein
VAGPLANEPSSPTPPARAAICPRPATPARCGQRTAPGRAASRSRERCPRTDPMTRAHTTRHGVRAPADQLPGSKNSECTDVHRLTAGSASPSARGSAVAPLRQLRTTDRFSPHRPLLAAGIRSRGDGGVQRSRAARRRDTPEWLDHSLVGERARLSGRGASGGCAVPGTGAVGRRRYASRRARGAAFRPVPVPICLISKTEPGPGIPSSMGSVHAWVAA